MKRRLPYNKIKMHKTMKYKNRIDHLALTLSNGKYGIIALENSIIRANHLETVRILSMRMIKKIGGKLYIRIKPNKSTTKKSLGVRMGKGKGSFDDPIYYTKKNEIIFEYNYINLDVFLTLYKKVKNKMPLKVGIFKDSLK